MQRMCPWSETSAQETSVPNITLFMTTYSRLSTAMKINLLHNGSTCASSNASKQCSRTAILLPYQLNGSLRKRLLTTEPNGTCNRFDKGGSYGKTQPPRTLEKILTTKLQGLLTQGRSLRFFQGRPQSTGLPNSSTIPTPQLSQGSHPS